MARVTVEDCIDKIPNRYDLVLISAQRARDISAGAHLCVDRDNDKNSVVALREIAENRVSIEDLQRLNTNKNNKLVCYEFNMIYSIFLNKLGINFISLDRCGSPIKDEDYANVHASIKSKVGDYLVFADSVTSILGGDLINAKLDEPLLGITCKNNDLKMKKQFHYTKKWVLMLRKKLIQDII